MRLFAICDYIVLNAARRHNVCQENKNVRKTKWQQLICIKRLSYIQIAHWHPPCKGCKKRWATECMPLVPPSLNSQLNMLNPEKKHWKAQQTVLNLRSLVPDPNCSPQLQEQTGSLMGSKDSAVMPHVPARCFTL